jgi:hypothetical protein
MENAIATLHDRRVQKRADLHYNMHFKILDESEALNQVGKLESKNRAADPKTYSADMNNISLGGIGIHGLLNEPLKEDSLLEIIIELPGSSVRCVGTVVWLEKFGDTFTAGIAFLEMDRDALSRVEKVISEALKNSAA